MGEEAGDQAPEGVVYRVSAGDDGNDTEGHRRPPNVVSGDGPDSVYSGGATADGEPDDTQGHVRAPNVVSDDGPDGVYRGGVTADDEATEG